jgi:hypothetical protein
MSTGSATAALLHPITVLEMGMFLGMDSWELLARAAAMPEPCILDLSDVVMVYPPGTVALLLALEHRSKHGRSTEIRAPRSADVLNYLERIDLFRRAAPHATFADSITALRTNRRNATGTFTELLTPRGDGLQAPLNVAEAFLREHAPTNWRKIYCGVEETLGNVWDHSLARDSPAESYAQVQVYRGCIEIAVGDPGVGFRASLARNPELPVFASEQDALKAVLLQRLSCRSHLEPFRGGGLRRALNAITGAGGWARIATRGAAAVHTVHAPEPVLAHTGTLFPGTLLNLRIPKQRP